MIDSGWMYVIRVDLRDGPGVALVRLCNLKSQATLLNLKLCKGKGR